MADSEWWCVETSSGSQLTKPGVLPPQSRFANREEANAVAKALAPGYEDLLTTVKYTRKEVRTFQRQIVINEADVPVA